MLSIGVSEKQMNRDNKNILNIYKDGKKTIPMSLVNRALEELATRASAGVQKQRKNTLERLCKSLLRVNEKPDLIIRSMLEAGVSIKEIFESFIPDAARQLGNHWVQSKLSFAEVTLATMRLQTIARTFEDTYMGSVNAGAFGPEIMIINLKGEQHTFGAQMICRQFRRLGASPFLSIDNDAAEIKML